ncbi:MAG TPA: hypothetical protein VFB21_18105 [Chthonomonadaceae bacterium]|nr:hypothetical protein [Chthonomonadaceae bacterium]
MSRSFWLRLLTASLLCGGLAVLAPAALAHDDPWFSGYYSGPIAATPLASGGIQMTGTLTDPTATFDLTTARIQHVMSPSSSGYLVEGGTAIFESVTGRLFATYSGTGYQRPTDRLPIVEGFFHITQGEGVFTGHTGKGSFWGMVDLPNQRLAISFSAVLVEPVPEPGALALLVGSGLSLSFLARRALRCRGR